MLVLTRRQNEAIRIGDDIEVTVVSIREDCVKLGITTSHSVTVDRQEIYEKKKAEKDNVPKAD